MTLPCSNCAGTCAVVRPHPWSVCSSPRTNNSRAALGAANRTTIFEDISLQYIKATIRANRVRG